MLKFTCTTTSKYGHVWSNIGWLIVNVYIFTIESVISAYVQEYYQHQLQQVADNMFSQRDSQDGYQQQTQQPYQQQMQ